MTPSSCRDVRTTTARSSGDTLNSDLVLGYGLPRFSGQAHAKFNGLRVTTTLGMETSRGPEDPKPQMSIAESICCVYLEMKHVEEEG